MKINVVIVANDVDRGSRVARQLADDLRKNFRGWTMHTHVRKSDTLTTDDAYAEYTG